MQDLIQISDFPLAASLSTLGFQLLKIDHQNPERVKFCFQYSKELDKTIQAFWRGDICVEPKLFYFNQKLIKNRIFSNQ